jgi:hypothetical protein
MTNTATPLSEPRLGRRRVLSLSLAWERLAQPLLISVMIATAVGLVGGAVTASVARSRPARYLSQATVLLDQPVAMAISGSEGVVVKLSDLREKYVALAATAPVIDAAANLAGLTPGVVAGDQLITEGQNSLTIQVGGQSTDPRVARQVAQGMAQAISQYVAHEQAGLPQDAVPPVDRIEARVIQPASAPAKVSPSNRRVAVAAALVLVVLWLLAYAVTQLALTRRLRIV